MQAQQRSPSVMRRFKGSSSLRTELAGANTREVVSESVCFFAQSSRASLMVCLLAVVLQKSPVVAAARVAR